MGSCFGGTLTGQLVVLPQEHGEFELLESDPSQALALAGCDWVEEAIRGHQVRIAA
jgi:hypothetical protein